MTVFLGVPTPGHVVTEFAFALGNLFAAAGKLGGMQYRFTSGDALLTHARDDLANAFLASKASVFIGLDSDLVVDARDVVELAQSDLDFAALTYPRKYILWDEVTAAARAGAAPTEVAAAGFDYTHKAAPDAPVVTHRGRRYVDAERVGFGCVVIKRAVFERLAESAPRYQSAPGQERIQFFRQIAENGQLVSEDYDFCDRWRATGGKIHVALDMHATPMHVGRHVFGGAVAIRKT